MVNQLLHWLLHKSVLYTLKIVLSSLHLLNSIAQKLTQFSFKALMFCQKLKLKLNYLFKLQQEQFTKVLRQNFMLHLPQMDRQVQIML